MKCIKAIFGIILLCCFTINVNAQREVDAITELLQELTIDQKKEILQYAKQQEAGIDGEIIAILARLPKEKKQALLEYAFSMSQSNVIDLPKSARNAEPAAPKHDHGPTTVMTFREATHDFGTVEEGTKVKHTFIFENTGTEPLLISNARGSCGCTVPQWPRTPIAPGAKSEITVEFNSSKKSGKRNQQVTITANTEPHNTIINLVGEVTPAGK
jgi:hypothetical protein